MNYSDEVKKLLSDRDWRINNLYYIKDAKGKKVKFKLNDAQKDLYEHMHSFNVILKARQLGFTTFCMIYFLDACLFNRNHSAGVIAHTRDISEDLFKNKIKFAYDNLPDWLKSVCSATSDSARQLVFSNGSSITVGTSLRSGTFQKLLVSEYGKISARYPEKAVEIKTGAFNTVHAGQEIFVESTAEGASGEFYDLCNRALRLEQMGAELTDLDPKLFFYAWHKCPEYKLSAEVSITAPMEEYFDKIGVNLTAGQRAWYVKKAEQQGEQMKREFPSTPEEAFEQSMEGSIYNQQMAMVRKNGQITRIPYEHSKPVYTFWDLGRGSDYMSIWFFQQVGNDYRFIDYHESNGEGYGYYAKLLQAKGYVYAEHVLPHDGGTNTIGTVLSTTKEQLENLGIRPCRVVPRTNDLWADIIGPCRNIMPRCFFDEIRCSQGIKHLDNYRRKWDEKTGMWMDKPLHDESSHCADAFRTFAMGYMGRHSELYGWNNNDEIQFADDGMGDLTSMLYR